MGSSGKNVNVIPDVDKQKHKISGAHAQNRRILHSHKVKSGRYLCVLGKYVTINMVTSLSSRALMVRFGFIRITRLEILECITKTWKPLIDYVPRVTMLVNSWVVFHFLFEDSL